MEGLKKYKVPCVDVRYLRALSRGQKENYNHPQQGRPPVSQEFTHNMILMKMNPAVKKEATAEIRAEDFTVLTV